MFNRSVYQDLINLQQHSKGFINMARNAFIHSLILEHGHDICVNNLPLYDRKILLSYVIDPSEYEYYSSNSTRLDAAISNNLSFMQSLLDFQVNRISYLGVIR